MTARLRLVVVLASLAFAAAHALALPRTLGDIDSINFALGVEDFDVARHQPHPPGYPVFIAMAKGTTAAVKAAAPSWDRDKVAATGLAIIGVAAGAMATVVLTHFWIGIGLAPALAVLAAVLSIASPLFWLTAGRPLSDVAGLVAAMSVLAVLCRAWNNVAGAPEMRALRWGALAAGVAIGLRSQTLWQTAPVLAAIVLGLLLAGRWRDATAAIGWGAAGVLLWFVPLVAVSGGLSGFLASLGSQGAEDFSGVEMLATMPSRDLLERAIGWTFASPWLAPGLAWAILVPAAAGFVRLMRTNRRGATLLLLGFGPYLVLHLLFHETATLRYALPMVVPVAGLAVHGLGLIGTRLALGAGALLVAASLWVVQPALLVHGRDGVAVFRAFQDMLAARAAMPEPPRLRMHHQVWWGTDRASRWYSGEWDVVGPPFPGDREVEAVVREELAGAPGPVWFLTDLNRTDLDVFDPRSATLRGRYVADERARRLMGGNRLDSLGWFVIDRPRWMLGTGWAINPELAGMTAVDRSEPHRRPAAAFIRRDAAPGLQVLVGGRYVGPGGGPVASVVVEFEGQRVDAWTASAEDPWFVRWLTLPSDVPAGEVYARLAVRIGVADPAASVPEGPLVALEQFDAAPAGTLQYAFEGGWYERESDPRRGTGWRWASDDARLDVRGASRDVTLVLTGESPLRYFASPTTVRIVAGDREVGRFTPDGDFAQAIIVPAAALAASGGRLAIRSSQAFVPAERGESADRRRLALRLFRVDVKLP